MDRVEAELARDSAPSPDEVTEPSGRHAKGIQRETAAYLIVRGANLGWTGRNRSPPFDIPAAPEPTMKVPVAGFTPPNRRVNGRQYLGRRTLQIRSEPRPGAP